jgi:hypothetical protein
MEIGNRHVPLAHDRAHRKHVFRLKAAAKT